MRKLFKIKCINHNEIICFFENGEVRILNLEQSIQDRYVDKILSNEQIFKSAKIGALGELYWEGIGEIRQLNGEITPCEYDISAEFVYSKSLPFEN